MVVAAASFDDVLAIAGFGNLSGELSFWDRKTCKCLGTVDAHMSVAYEWSPDSKYFLTAILFPRLRVDNGYRIWSCNGNLLPLERTSHLRSPPTTHVSRLTFSIGFPTFSLDFLEFSLGFLEK